MITPITGIDTPTAGQKMAATRAEIVNTVKIKAVEHNLAFSGFAFIESSPPKTHWVKRLLAKHLTFFSVRPSFTGPVALFFPNSLKLEPDVLFSKLTYPIIVLPVFNAS